MTGLDYGLCLSDFLYEIEISDKVSWILETLLSSKIQAHHAYHSLMTHIGIFNILQWSLPLAVTVMATTLVTTAGPSCTNPVQNHLHIATTCL